MRIHYFQHIPFEGVASIGRWATIHGHPLTATKFYQNDHLPDIKTIDWLIVMGGPMNIYEEDKYPWLAHERAFIREAIASEKTIVGICLGAQLLADLLGGKVYRGAHKEIGWFPISLSQEARQSEVFGFLPEQFMVFHWHGDTFRLPPEALPLARSAGCENQAFLYHGRVLALQFHLEVTAASVRQMVQHGDNEMVPDKYVQSAADVLAAPSDRFQRMNNAMFGILDRLPK